MNAFLVLPILLIQADPQREQWDVGGVKREALVVTPEKESEKGAPVVFVFHGHGGTMQRFAQNFAVHKHWPEAIVVYPQGLLTPGRTDPEGKKPGWQHARADQQDRDLKFVDTMLAWLKKNHRVDESRIYSTGHSNGGGFTYVLWANRGDVFAAFAPSSSPATANLPALKPHPAMHIAGEKDMVAPFAAQQRTMEEIRRINGCASEGKEWEKVCLLYESPTGTPVVTLVHSGGHQFPPESAALVAKFFQEVAVKKAAPK
jgi:polyhydroxybutyrate depolymerase